MTFFGEFLEKHPIISFLTLTLLISLGAFVLMMTVRGADKPEGLPGLPIWLIAIWSPTFTALLIQLQQGKLLAFLKNSIRFNDVNGWWGLAFLPVLVGTLIILFEVAQGASVQWGQFKIRYIVPLMLLNLIMGPLGEEFGWRGFLLPLLDNKLGLIGASLAVGIIWAFWHAPLWLVDSPQSNIFFPVFVVNVLCFSFIMTFVYRFTGGNLVPIILFHLLVNVVSGVVDILGVYKTQGVFYQKMLPVYCILTSALLIWFMVVIKKQEAI